MAKEFDTSLLNGMVTGVLTDTFKKMCGVDFATSPVVLEKDIIEYNGNMRVFAMEKFNGPAYVTVANYYLSQQDQEAGAAVGTFILFVKESVAEKFFRAFGRSVKEAEEESKVLDIMGELCSILAEALKKQIASSGYADLVLSNPLKYKNNVPEGAPFDYSLFKKTEIMADPWGQKCVAVEVSMGNVPVKTK